MRELVLEQRRQFLTNVVNNTNADHVQALLARYEVAVQEAASSGMLIDADNGFPPATDKWSIVQVRQSVK